MKILLIGATGTIGSAVYSELSSRHEIITAGRNGADIPVDITSPESIVKMYEAVGMVDAVINTAGNTFFGSFSELTLENNEIALQSKLKGQINLVLLGRNYVNDHGSFTLTTGITMDDPIVGGVSAAMACGAISAFVKSAALEMPRGIRINNISPTVLEESIDIYEPYFPGFVPVPGSKVASAFRKSVEGAQTGQTYRVY
ncbi:NAD(P)-dependent dehydrogenase (short-subunit alcohol dehydrogenase family) [Ureibacillus xyleni]|uniref:NAD(P)-dependent dehydrogenase (Short-subunit alcohol dehydrogenase family) n=1 Tax=Ureibacillus xyleni TaxID=614648 RepID=A0A285SKB8_9BACL|nr:short chain dehydrogenase [Ureibacillus xyleni]SOC06418.1 NAD(P)-dependent dehydrogenase (short-subunit alcohol dehydrogenase family) [Ureibacillus xyleni]